MNAESTITILAVDDDEGHRELVRRNLKRAGLANPVIGLSNGADALDYIFCRGAYASRRADTELVVLLDVNMPGTNGFEVLRQIKGDPSKRTIPVIMFSTTDDPREIKRCYDIGCSGYVTKPVDPSAFIEAVTRVGMFLSVVRAPEES
jgi:CheY-like chemotaxis protein